MVDEDIDEQILMLYSEDKWKDIVNLNYVLNKTDKSRLFWVLPTINDLHWIKESIEKYNLTGLVSIGCGCGLLEWLFQKYSGLEVIGVELDRSWWCSKYSPPLFLNNMVFIRENSTNSTFLLDKYALLFCYFNDASAFCYYIENYKGNLIFVIGPKENQDRWTDPMPFDAKFANYGWTLICKTELERTSDYITVYADKDIVALKDQEGKNKLKVYCTFCSSKMLNASAARLVNIEFNLPHIHHKGEGEADQQELITDYWLVEDMYTFENIGVSHTVDNVKYLACADCERGPVGWHDLSTKKSYIALNRVKHE